MLTIVDLWIGPGRRVWKEDDWPARPGRALREVGEGSSSSSSSSYGCNWDVPIGKLCEERRRLGLGELGL